ncbi:MAG: YeeE/YedE family protein [Hyphomicrobiaceae bacterium]|nr:YeeE/YedE family protein [Hyphomicrobiaceae bacterium]
MFDLAIWAERLGDGGAAAAIGAILGLAFGILAQRTGFCARSAFIDIGRGSLTRALPVWLAALGAALISATVATASGAIALASVSLKVDPVSVSGAVVGGALFGIGMVLARGCASRHVVLAGTGNLRSWATLAVFAVVAFAAIAGPLAPMRRAAAGLWTISPVQNELANLFGGLAMAPLAIGVTALLAAIALAFANRTGRIAVFGGAGIGLLLTAGWVLTSMLAGQTFEPTRVETIAFTGPATKVFEQLLSVGAGPISFQVALIPAVAVGAALASLPGGFRLQWFATPAAIGRYVIGGTLMGFGGALASGCTVGALGNAALSISVAWIALLAMAAGAILTDRLIDSPARPSISPSTESDRLLPTGQFVV